MRGATLGGVALATTAARGRVQGANDRISIGLIGNQTPVRR